MSRLPAFFLIVVVIILVIAQLWRGSPERQRAPVVDADASAALQSVDEKRGEAGLAADAGSSVHQQSGAVAQALESHAPATGMRVAQHEPPHVLVEVMAEGRLPANAKMPARTVRIERWRDIRQPVRIEQPDDGQASYALASQMLVRLAADASAAQLEATARAAGAHRISQLGRGRFYRVHLDPVPLDAYDRVRAALSADDGAVAYVEPDYLRSIRSTPGDTDFGRLWGMHNTGQSGGTTDADIDALEAWEITTGSSEVVVGVIDSGVNYTHPDLAANIWTNPGESGDGKETNGIDDDGNGYIDDVHGWDFSDNDNDPMDTFSHGSHCSGTIGAVGDNGTGVVGVCWNVRIAALKWSTSDTNADSAIIEAIEYATAMGFRVTNNSYGSSQFSQAMSDAVAAAGAAGQVFVVAAGNAGRDNDTTPDYPSGFAHENVIAVSATDHNDTIDSQSNFGATTVDLGAPGVDIYSTVLGTSYKSESGTSMAAPHVTGALALMLARKPDATVSELRTALLDSVDPLPSLAGKTVTGGRLNVHAALLALPLGLETQGLHFVDDGSHGSSGDGDGWFEAGERIAMVFSVRNGSAVDMTGIDLALTTTDPLLTLVDQALSVGALSAGASSGTLALRIDVASVIAAPIAAPLTLTMSNDEGGSWDEEHILELNELAAISGFARRLTGNAPIAGASIQFDGANDVTFTSAGDGSYSGAVPLGSYTVTGSAAGFHDEVITEVVVTSSGATLDLLLGRPLLAVTPAILNARLPTDAAGTFDVMLRNIGDKPLTVATAGVTGSGNGGGYSWADSDGGTVSHTWEDISMTGTILEELSLGMVAMQAIELPFSFPFYSTSIASIHVGGSGYLSTSPDFLPDNGPTQSLPGMALAPYWDSLFGIMFHSVVLVHGNGERMIIQYQDFLTPEFGFVTFQVVLYPDGRIAYNYHVIEGSAAGCTVGIRGDDSTFIEVARNEPYVHSDLTIAFTPQPGWLQAELPETVVQPGDAIPLAVLLDSAKAPSNPATGAVLLAHDDPTQPGELSFPVTLTAIEGLVLRAIAILVSDATGAPIAADPTLAVTVGGVTDLNDGSRVFTGLPAADTHSLMFDQLPLGDG